MRIIETAGAIALVALIAACDSGGSERGVWVPQGDGEHVTVRTGSGIAAPRNMPAYAPIYPGGAIESSMDGVSTGVSGGQTGGMVSFSTSDNQQKVADFYRARLDASGLIERGEVNLNGVIVLTGAAADDSNRGVQIAISPAAEGSGSVVSLTYSGGNG